MNSFNQSIFVYGYLNNGNQQFYVLRSCLFNQGKFNKAIYIKAIEESPQYAAYHNRGNAFQSLANFEQAIKDYSLVIDINPQYTAFFNRALVLQNRESFKKQQSIILNSYTWFLKMHQHIIIEVMEYFRKANANQNLGNYKEAIEDYSKSIEMNPQYAVAYNRGKNIMYIFGNAYVNRGKFDEAIIDCSKALKLQRQNAYVFMSRQTIFINKQIHIKIGEILRSNRRFFQALELNSKHAAAHYNRGKEEPIKNKDSSFMISKYMKKQQWTTLKPLNYCQHTHYRFSLG
ncbi:unnamed protein product [Paramecium octaurelia]|uniref:Tetratricopeptide repeat protein n=1 Tax=Paramecium octaurelia TaxID=43137 RepID=A0A8S1WDJ0_PAROT|nr:unnamed protein product [Paramecium octaurelia]